MSGTLHAAVEQTPAAIIRIRPSKGWVDLKLAELWEYRELVYFLTWREIKIRYKQTVLGASWALLQPLFSILIFSVVFGKFAKIPSDGIPYPIFSLAGMVPWLLFANGLTQSSNSLVANQNLITKVYFPRLAVPISAVLSGVLDFFISLLLLGAGMIYFHIAPGWNMLWLPLFFALVIVTSLGVGLWLAALNVEYRDVRYVVPFLSQLWMYATPIAYPSSLFPEPWRTLIALNPMVGVVEGFRWCLLRNGSAPGWIFTASVVTAVFLLVSGAYYFRRMEKNFADLV